MMSERVFWARGKTSTGYVRGRGVVLGRWQPWHKTKDGERGLCGVRIPEHQGDYRTADLGTEGWLVRGRICKNCKELPR